MQSRGKHLQNKQNPQLIMSVNVYDGISSQAMDFQTIKKSPELNLPRYFAYVQEMHLFIPTEELKIKLSV